MANDAYKVLKAVTIPKAVSRLDDDVEGNARYQTEGKLYSEDEYVLAKDITPPLRERAENGEFDDFLEPVSLEEAEDALRASDFGVFAPEHEVERVTLKDYGHTVIEKEQILELNSAGAEAAREAQEEAKADDADARPQITEQPTFVEVPSLAEASTEGKTVLPSESEHVDVEGPVQTMPSGVVVEATADKPKSRKRPGTSKKEAAASESGPSGSGSEGGNE